MKVHRNENIAIMSCSLILQNQTLQSVKIRPSKCFLHQEHLARLSETFVLYKTMEKEKKKEAGTCEALELIICINKDLFSLLRYEKGQNTGFSTQRASHKQSKICRISHFFFLSYGFKYSMEIQTLSQHSPKPKSLQGVTCRFF